MTLETRIITPNFTGMPVYFHPKIHFLPLSNGRFHHRQICDIPQLINLSLTLTNRNKAYITKDKYTTETESI